MTRKIWLIAGVAGLALTAPASAEKGGKGGGNKPEQAEAQQAQQAPRPERAERAQAQRPERQERPQAQRVERQQMPRVERQERPQMPRFERQERPQRVERQMQRIERPQRVERFERPQRVERQVQRVDRQERRIERQERRVERPARIDREQRVERQERRVERREIVRPRQIARQQQRVERQQQRTERRAADRIVAPRDDARTTLATSRFDARGMRPAAPILSTRAMRPMKPFKTKFDERRTVSIGERFEPSFALAPVPTIYASRYVDTPDYYYRYNNDLGYAYQVDRDDGIVRSMFPLFGGYGIGDPWPSTYYSSYVPLGYQDYYYDTPDYYYRNDGYGIYQVDGTTQLITALVALLTGQNFGIGQMLPASYGAYNVPMAYRSNYYDTDDSWYRYGDGFIYQVDPFTRRIEERYPLYADNYYVGDAWPVAYPDYNVPYGYRSTYYDTPQHHYRYADGGIYQVDPTNQVIQALVALLSGNQFGVGQAMPAGYGTYNVPLDYRDRYADSDDQWYRYADGTVYRVDPTSGLIEEAIPLYA